jgi:hypothetical protein
LIRRATGRAKYIGVPLRSRALAKPGDELPAGSSALITPHAGRVTFGARERLKYVGENTFI